MEEERAGEMNVSHAYIRATLALADKLLSQRSLTVRG